MNPLLVWAALVAVCTSHAIPKIPVDNSHYEEGKSRYIWMPDGKGKPVLVDLREPLDEHLLRTKSGANNQYWLFTRADPNKTQVLIHGNSKSVKRSNYAGHRPLKVIAHGWKSNGNSPMNPLITSAFLAVQDCNVVVVDWSALANGNYKSAAAGVPNVGQHLGNFLVWLIKNFGGSWNNVHLVGFSLGAHVVGNAGRQSGNRPARITGLDPAGPLWGRSGHVLNKNMGQYVEVIHTDGNVLGIFNAIGDADFYPNGGKSPQPGCLVTTCSHGRAAKLFASSVYHANRFVGRRCNTVWDAELSNCNGDYFVMGNNDINKRGIGIYGLSTDSAWPF